jgi:hypothetical protein
MNDMNLDSKGALADAGAASSIFLWFTSHALEWMPILQALSLLVAIAAGCAAAYYHISRAAK